MSNKLSTLNRKEAIAAAQRMRNTARNYKLKGDKFTRKMGNSLISGGTGMALGHVFGRLDKEAAAMPNLTDENDPTKLGGVGLDLWLAVGTNAASWFNMGGDKFAAVLDPIAGATAAIATYRLGETAAKKAA